MFSRECTFNESYGFQKTVLKTLGKRYGFQKTVLKTLGKRYGFRRVFVFTQVFKNGNKTLWTPFAEGLQRWSCKASKVQKFHFKKRSPQGSSKKMKKFFISDDDTKSPNSQKSSAETFRKKFQKIVKYEAFWVYRTHPLISVLDTDIVLRPQFIGTIELFTVEFLPYFSTVSR